MLSSQLPLPARTRPLHANAPHPHPPLRTRSGPKTDLPEDLQDIKNSPEKIAQIPAAISEFPIPLGVEHLSPRRGELKFTSKDFDAAELERLVGDYGPLIKEVNLS